MLPVYMLSLLPTGRLPQRTQRIAIMANAIFWDKAAKKYAASKIGDTGGYEETLAGTRSFLH